MIVFTNGCFDVIHPGHVDLLDRARDLGSKLIVGINSDRSVRSIKGPGRPIQDEQARRSVLLGLRAVDEVLIFDEPTPARLIEDLRPDVLVKGGDWRVSEIIGADHVLGYGGQVHSLPIKEGFSSSSIIDKIKGSEAIDHNIGDSITENSIKEHIQVAHEVLRYCRQAIAECFELIYGAFHNNRKILICGNGGSAADSQHIAAEFVGRYETERKALNAIALSTDTSAITAIGNDYGFDRIFSRQVEALAVPGDCLIALSTSGMSPNVILAAMEARRRGCTVIGMTGKAGRKLASLSDGCILVPSNRTSRIQEAHITIAHVWCEMIDNRISHGG